MAELKTKENSASVAAFLNAVEDTQKRADAKKIAAMMREATGSRPKCGVRVLLALAVTITSMQVAVRATGS
jgi:hypothetical protein